MKVIARIAASLSAAASLVSSWFWLNSATLQETATKVSAAASQLSQLAASGQANAAQAAELAASAAAASASFATLSGSMNTYAAMASMFCSATLLVLACFGD